MKSKEIKSNYNYKKRYLGNKNLNKMLYHVIAIASASAPLNLSLLLNLKLNCNYKLTVFKQIRIILHYKNP